MRRTSVACCMLLGSSYCSTWAQSVPGPEQRSSHPLYQVTIVARTTKAINYGYLSMPTTIGFRGTPVAPFAAGKASIEPKRGSTLVNLKLKDLPPPGRFGPQFLTYVVWAISLDGRAQNLGELVLDGSTKGKLSTSTPLQTFALIVTAEPHYAVSQPGDVVVLENVVLPETVGKVQEVNASYELLPRQPFTYNAAGEGSAAPGKKVSAKEYEATTALYQALNAIQIAQSLHADRHAPGQMARARQLYDKARGYPIDQSKEIVSMAREVTQIAEDARAIAVKREAAEQQAPLQGRATQSTEPSHGGTNTEGSQSRREAESQVAPPPPQPEAYARPQAVAPIPSVPPKRWPRETAIAVEERPSLPREDPNARENRLRLLAALPRDFEVLDSSRGVIITIPEPQAESASLSRYYFPAVAAVLRQYPRLRLTVEAHSDTPNSFDRTEREAMRVKAALISAGITPEIIFPRGYGNARPRSSNATSSGAAQNRRVEILIAGDPIGTIATWDRSYKLQAPASQRQP